MLLSQPISVVPATPDALTTNAALEAATRVDADAGCRLPLTSIALPVGRGVDDDAADGDAEGDGDADAYADGDAAHSCVEASATVLKLYTFGLPAVLCCPATLAQKASLHDTQPVSHVSQPVCWEGQHGPSTPESPE